MSLDLSNWFRSDYTKLYGGIGIDGKYHSMGLSIEERAAIYYLHFSNNYSQSYNLATAVMKNGYILNDRTNLNSNIQTSYEIAADDFIITAGGSDLIIVNGGDDLVVSGDGNDSVMAGDGQDNVFGGKGDDLIHGGAGDDWLFGDAQIKKFDNTPHEAGTTVSGLAWFGALVSVPFTAGGSLITATAATAATAADVALKDPQLKSEDILNGTRFSTEHGEQAYINLDQEVGNDTIKGGEGNDMILAGRGADRIDGGAGNDVIDAGARGSNDNHDIVYGGAGNDVFILGSMQDNENEYVINMMKFLRAFNQGRDASTIDLELLQNDDSGGGFDFEQLGVDLGLAVTDQVVGLIPGVGTVLGPAISTVAESLVSWLREEETDSSRDMIDIMDFNPFEDSLALPMQTDVMISVNAANMIAAGGIDTPLEVSYAFGDAGTDTTSTVLANVYLADNWMDSLYVDPNWSTYLEEESEIITTSVAFEQAFWNEILDRSVSLSVSTGQVIIDSDAPMGSDASFIHMIGNTGPLSRYAINAVENVLIGGNSADKLYGNNAHIDVFSNYKIESSLVLNGGRIKVFGLDGDDYIQGTIHTDILDGGAGDDTIFGLGTNVAAGVAENIFGGTGDDKIYIGQEFGEIYVADGGDGTDMLSFKASETGHRLELSIARMQADVVTHYFMSDTTLGSSVASDSKFTGFEVYEGSRFADYFDFSNSWDSFTFRGGEGADTIQAGRSQNDTVDYTGSDAGVKINLRRDIAEGGHAQGDKLTGFENVIATMHDDTIVGTTRGNTLQTKDGNDKVYGLSGNDTILTGNGNDWVNSGTGHDMVFGGDGSDILLAAQGDDTVDAGNGDDRVQGGDGFDELKGGSGNDTLVGGRQDDVLVGGKGEDTFIFNSNDGRDQITDFNSKTDVLAFDAMYQNRLKVSDVERVSRNSEEGTMTIDYGIGNWVKVTGLFDKYFDASDVIEFI